MDKGKGTAKCYDRSSIMLFEEERVEVKNRTKENSEKNIRWAGSLLQPDPLDRQMIPNF
jgi:hypothetical protein